MSDDDEEGGLHHHRYFHPFVPGASDSATAGKQNTIPLHFCYGSWPLGWWWGRRFYIGLLVVEAMVDERSVSADFDVVGVVAFF